MPLRQATILQMARLSLAPSRGGRLMAPVLQKRTAEDGVKEKNYGAVPECWHSPVEFILAFSRSTTLPQVGLLFYFSILVALWLPSV